MKLYDDGLVQAAFYPTDAVEIQEWSSVGALMYNIHEETIDILSIASDSSGKMVFVPNGRMLKKMAHIEGAPHMAAHIWIFNSQWEVLIQKRSLTKDSYPGLWDISAAGHISSGETMLQWAMREISEEIGLDIQEDDLIPVGYYREEVKFVMQGHENGWHNNELNGIFLLRYDGDVKNLALQEEEVADVKFISLSQLETEWGDETQEELHVPKAWGYREHVISALKDALKRIS